MIIPIRCFTCGQLVGDLWNDYQKRLQERKNELINTKIVLTDLEKSTLENEILNEMGLKRYCCRRMLLCNVDVCDKI